jgi:hypothetical protein
MRGVDDVTVLPRFIRHRDAPRYLGMDRHRFNAEVRPTLTEIPIGEQGIAFDRLDLDDWAEDYKARNGRRPKAAKLEDDVCRSVDKCRGSASRAIPGTSRSAVRNVPAGGSGRARERLAELRRSGS